MMSSKWYVTRANGDRWNALHASWGFWVFGTDYPNREAAEADALLLTVKCPEYIGKISVLESI
jgi:hypothetical protein